MVSLMAKGGYDLVTASGDASLRLIMGKRVQPINTALIPNWKTLDPRVVKGDWFNVGAFGCADFIQSNVFRTYRELSHEKEVV